MSGFLKSIFQLKNKESFFTQDVFEMLKFVSMPKPQFTSKVSPTLPIVAYT